MRDGLIIFTLCLVAIIIGGWLFFYAPSNIAIFPHDTSQSVSYTPPQSGGAAQEAGVEVAFSELTSGTNAKVAEPKNYAVHASDAMSQIWSKLGQTPPPPKVDFTKHDVIAVLAGQKPTGGYSVKVEKITDINGKRVVSIVLTEPGAHCTTTEAITSPYDLVAAPASAFLPVRQLRTVTKDCQ
jgi:hypothetical protein